MKSPAFQLYVRDLLCSDTFRQCHKKLPRAGTAYIYLLCESWLQAATLPADAEELQLLARIIDKSEWEQIWAIIGKQFIETTDGRLYNERLMKEFMKQQERGNKARKAANAKWEQQRERASAESSAKNNGADASRRRKQKQAQAYADAYANASKKMRFSDAP